MQAFRIVFCKVLPFLQTVVLMQSCEQPMLKGYNMKIGFSVYSTHKITSYTVNFIELSVYNVLPSMPVLFKDHKIKYKT
jgi:hypothetical protein